MQGLGLELLNSIGPAWGWSVFLGWFFYQLYNPFWCTKLQQFHRDLTERLERIEITQLAIGEEVAGVDEEVIAEVHGKRGLSTSDLKEQAQE